jgi:serine/threonine-protein kinase
MPSRRRCVIKQLKPVTHDPQAYKLVQERFQREAAVLEELGEGNNQIPRLYAYFSEAGQFYLVQEWIEGDTLTKKVEQGGTLSENEVKQILVSLLPVLDYVHSRRMVHRDIKPDNIIIRKRDGLPVLIDFGAVKEAMNTVVNVPGNSAQSMVIGTPGFMSSEQAGGRPTYASDLYSLGLTAVFLLTGKMPQELETDARTGELLWRQYAPDIHSNLAMVLDQAIRFNPRDRFATATAMLNALQSAAAPSEMATVAVSPGGVQQAPNGSTPPLQTLLLNKPFPSAQVP